VFFWLCSEREHSRSISIRSQYMSFRLYLALLLGGSCTEEPVQWNRFYKVRTRVFVENSRCIKLEVVYSVTWCFTSLCHPDILFLNRESNYKMFNSACQVPVLTRTSHSRRNKVCRDIIRLNLNHVCRRDNTRSLPNDRWKRGLLNNLFTFRS
jgi:hypothetical protein